MAKSTFLATLTPDPPIVQDANFRFSPSDRQFLDDQNQAAQAFLTTCLVGGATCTYIKVDPGGPADLLAGDVVCLSSSTTGVPMIAKATTGTTLTNAGSVFGVVMQAAPRASMARVAIGGAIPPSLTGLPAGLSGYANLNPSTGRITRSGSASVYCLGTIDNAGFLSIRASSGGGGNSAGTITIVGSAGGTSKTGTVTFSTAETDALYSVTSCTCTVRSGTPATGSLRAYASNKSTSGFTINLEVDPGAGAQVDIGWTTARPAAGPAPTLVSITPTSGATSGGTTFTLSGTNFRPGISVYFAGAPATSIVVVNSTTVTGAAPTGTTGTAGVFAQNSDNSVSNTISFTYSAVSTPLTGMTAWFRADTLTQSGGAVTQWTDKSGNGNHLVPVGVSPTYVASSSTVGFNSQPTVQFTKGASARGMHCSSISFAFGSQFTVYIMLARNSGLSGVYEFFMSCESSNRANINMVPSPNYLYVDNGTQVNTGITMDSTAQALTAVFAGTASGFAKSSETFDYAADVNQFGFSNPIFGDAYSSTAGAYSSGSEMAEILIYPTAHTKTQQQAILAYFNFRYGIAIDKDPVGSIYRHKMAFDTGTPSAPSEPMSSLLTSGGALRLYTRARAGADAVPISTFPKWSFSQDNANTGPWSTFAPDGSITVRNAGTDYVSTVCHAFDMATDVEMYSEIGGGHPPRVAFRNDPTLPWMPLPFDSPSSIGALSLTGTMTIGGNTQTTPNPYASHPFPGIIHEVCAFDDTHQPAGLTWPTYVTGALVFAGNSITSMRYSGGWPAFCLRALSHAYPMPRVTGIAGQNIAGIQTNVATQIGNFYVTGGAKNIVTVLEGINSMNGGTTPAAAYAQMVTLCQGLQAQGWKVVIGTTMPSVTLNETNRNTYNALIVANWTTFADALADLAADTVMGQTGQYSNTTYYTDGTHPTSTGGKRLAGIFATAINSLL